jgi:adenosylcobinamide-phosphate synthase
VSLFAILAALAWAHFRPQRPEALARAVTRWHDWLLARVNAGERRQGMLAWSLGALAPALVVGMLGALLGWLASFLYWLLAVAVLYLCLGFRQDSFQASSIGRALAKGDLERARDKLSAWRPALIVAETEEGLTRQTLEETFKTALARLFGVLFWFMLAGVAGAVLYFLTLACREHWQGEPAFGAFAARIAGWLDWLPARAAAFGFAIAGNFQDALESWRTQAETWGDVSEGALLAAAGGALGARLGGTLPVAGGELLRPALGTDEAPTPEMVEGAVALVWRALFLWLAVLGLLWLGGL